jgi:hypothetical protein
VSYEHITLDELTEAVSKPKDFDTLIDNLINVQNRQGNHKQIFVDYHIKDIVNNLNRIKSKCNSNKSVSQMSFYNIPNSLVLDKVCELINKKYDEKYIVTKTRQGRTIKQRI